MGLSIETFCVTCKKAAPWLNDGEGGFVGHLSLSEEASTLSMGAQNFGYLYAAFDRLGLVTHDLYCFRRFLSAHSGHELVTATDDEIAGYDDYDNSSEDGPFDEVMDGWIHGRFEARCHDCRRRYRVDSAGYMQVRGESAVSRDAVAGLKKVVPSLSDNFYRCGPFDDDELAPLVRFLERHVEHRATTRIFPEEE